MSVLESSQDPVENHTRTTEKTNHVNLKETPASVELLCKFQDIFYIHRQKLTFTHKFYATS